MTDARPFRILGIQQIAIGGEDKQRLRSLWVDLLGFTFKDTYVSERENVNEDICAIGQGAHEVEVDLMQPVDIAKKPAVHQTPLNHIGLWVDDLQMAHGSVVKASASPLAEFVKALQATILFLSTPKAMMNFHSGVRAF